MPVHKVRCSLPYTREQLFDLAADVERYPEFVPWWAAARVWKRDGNVYYTDQVIRFAMVRKRFESRTVLRRPERIDVTSTDGPVRDLQLTWLFEPGPGNGSEVSLAVELELRSPLIEDVFLRAMVRVIGPIMAAFENQAHRLYDPARGSGIKPERKRGQRQHEEARQSQSFLDDAGGAN
jgi:coenzyme Q-binding protein COQ10